jgi:hypothetical protein
MTQGQTKHKQQKQKKLMLIRYGRMGLLGWFEHKESHIQDGKSGGDKDRTRT